MNRNEIYVIFQPQDTDNSYWTRLLSEGIRSYAAELSYSIHPIDTDNKEILKNLYGCPIIVAGNENNWLTATLNKLLELNLHPIVTDASTLSSYKYKCSSVVFEIENIIHHCVKLLKSAGKEKTVFLGANPNSVTDKVKCSIFGKSGETMWASEKIESCVDEFVSSVEKNSYDSVICANDTVAVCLMHKLVHTGCKVPDDLYIIGMGNSFIGSVLEVPLTSVWFDYFRMGITAAGLYLNLLKNGGDFHANVSLPCKLIVRQSAPILHKQNGHLRRKQSTITDSVYFSGDNIQNILRVEAMLQASGETDREILYSIARKESYDTISEKIFLCDRAIRYRISKLIAKYGFKSKEELEKALRYAINDE